MMEERLRECLRTALHYHVTDIHFNLQKDRELTIEMRVNGVIRMLKPQPDDLRFFRYLMFRADLDVSDILLPQTGRFEFEVDGRTLALRLALVSSLHMTSGVLRILNNHRPLTVDMLSTDPLQNDWFRDIPHHRSGFYLFSGPTGSGKTTTLYTILNEVEGKKIFTLEDPVEIYYDKYVQLQVNDKMNLGYAEGIKQLMRHDPDIVMVGEIRDSEAAEMAIRCALTGHLVVSTIHSSSCITAIERLLELGVSSFQLQDVLRGVINQRLYSTDSDLRITVYEIMNRKELMYYFKHKSHSPGYQGLTEKLSECIQNGYLTEAEAAEDLDR